MFPRACRRICVVHFQRNFVKVFQGPKLKALMMRASNAYNGWTHRKAMKALHKLSPAAHNWLLDEPKEHWCRLRKQVATFEVGPSRSQGRESTDLGVGPSNSQPITATTTSPKRFTRQLLLQAQKSNANKRRTGQNVSEPPLTIRDSSPITAIPSPSQPLSSATAEHTTNTRRRGSVFWLSQQGTSSQKLKPKKRITLIQERIRSLT
ncbi:hypothetical protein Cgig2_009230 [Carnegiea gigantea]|uniref:Transposase n=1 Tax=Carnegiea gigantea TaxID=171969 RepID=A0A9Q1K9E3_9CARY|nr:hypothetical protein Cgig2_009230 [Carnegiea gigantea]